MNTRRFTVIELITVIAIIAVLAALLLPALGRARAAGQRTFCMSNMRNIAMGVGSYHGDEQGFFPHNRRDVDYWGLGLNTTPTSYMGFQKGWAWQLKPHVGSWSIFFCPSQTSHEGGFPAPDLGFDPANFTNPISGIGQNHNGIGYHSANTANDRAGLFYASETDGSPQPSPTSRFFVKDSSLPKPENVVMVGDTACPPSGWWTSNSGQLHWQGWQDSGWSYATFPAQSFRHSSGANLTFADGHGQWHSRAELVQTQQFWDGGPSLTPGWGGRQWPFSW